MRYVIYFLLVLFVTSCSSKNLTKCPRNVNDQKRTHRINKKYKPRIFYNPEKPKKGKKEKPKKKKSGKRRLRIFTKIKIEYTKE